MRISYIVSILACFITWLSPAMSNGKTVHVKSLADFEKHTSAPGIRYVIREQIDLQGKTLTMPIESKIEFMGGTISNGAIVGNKTVLKGLSKGVFSGVFISGIFQVKQLSYDMFADYSDDTSLLCAMLNMLFYSTEKTTLKLEPNRRYNITAPKLGYYRAIFEYDGISDKRIEGNHAVLYDQRTRSMIGCDDFDGVFLFSNCHNIVISNLNYRLKDESFDEIYDVNGKIRLKAGIERQMGLVGPTFMFIKNDCSGFDIETKVYGPRYGLKVGDYNRYWFCGEYGLKNSRIHIEAEKNGYPVAIELGDSLDIFVRSDTHARAAYLCGLSNSKVRVEAKNICRAPIHCLLSDTHYSKGDKKNVRFKPCFNLDVKIKELGSELVANADAFCVAFQTYNTPQFYSRTEPLKWHDINVTVDYSAPAPRVGGATISRPNPSNEKDPLRLADVFKNIRITVNNPYEAEQYSMRLRISRYGVYDNIITNLHTPKSNVIIDNANTYEFDMSSSGIKGVVYSGKVNSGKTRKFAMKSALNN